MYRQIFLLWLAGARARVCLDLLYTACHVIYQACRPSTLPVVAIALLSCDYASRTAFAFIIPANRGMESCLRFRPVVDVSDPALKGNTIGAFLVSLIRPSLLACGEQASPALRGASSALRNYFNYIKIGKYDLAITRLTTLNSLNSIY